MQTKFDLVAGCDFGVPMKSGDQAKKIILIEAIRVGDRRYTIEQTGRNERLVRPFANEVSPKALKKVQSLDKMAADLRSGQQFKITRLTMLKSLCEDSEAAAEFALFLAKKAQQQLKASSYPDPKIK